MLNDGARCGIVAPTWADGRDVCVEGNSGLLSVIPEPLIEKWNRSHGHITLFNGSNIKIFSADKPDRLRGPQHHRIWCDEVASWRYPDALDQAMLGLRLGASPRIVLTTTPKPIPWLKAMVAGSRARTVLTRGTTFENAENLAASSVEALKKKYDGTRMGRQELYAELLTDTPGALWTHGMIEASRVAEAPQLSRVVIAIDPAVTAAEGSDETGIIAAGIAESGDCYVLEDASGRYSPDAWGRKAVDLYRRHRADRIVAEVNQGGDLVESNLRLVDRNLPITKVHAARGKAVRAEPVAALYEQGKVHHVGVFASLEDQLTDYVPGATGSGSPDRMDALVWAITHLALGSGDGPNIRLL